MTDPTAATRQSRRRAKVRAAGGQQVSVMIDAKASAALAYLRSDGRTVVEAINRALVFTAETEAFFNETANAYLKSIVE